MDAPPAGPPVPPRRPRPPARLSAWMAQARRDARMLLDGLRGRHPAPLVQRRTGSRDALRARASERAARILRVVEIERQTADAIGFALADPGGEERFSQPQVRAARDHVGRGGSDVETVRVQLGGRVHVVTVRPGETILDAALAAGLPMPFSCTMGGCGACKVKLRGGAVDMEEPSCLTPAERAAGHVLTCVGRPLGQVTIEVEA